MFDDVDIELNTIQKEYDGDMQIIATHFENRKDCNFSLETWVQMIVSFTE